MLTKCSDSEKHENNHVLPFDHETKSPQSIGSFQALLTQSNAMLTQSTQLQSMMQTNREKRLTIQQQITRFCRLIPLRSDDGTQFSDEQSILDNLRLKVSELDAEHIRLHQQFINLQGRIRQMVRSQRSSLVDSINKTRALTANTGSGLALVSGKPSDSTARNKTEVYNDLEPFSLQKSA